MRGKGNEIVAYIITDRITPAYAGKRLEDTFCTDTSWDHPRLCGEKVKILQFLLKVRGSPPPMRGKVLGLRTSGLLPRITPAYAGKRPSLEITIESS